nr:MAG TPA: hypothetical protein [Caudoviricetes sp.]
MEELISFDMMPDGIERYTVKNLKINPNLEGFSYTLRYNGKKYRINIHFGYISVYRVGLFNLKELLFFFEAESNHHESRFELVKELLNLSKDEMQRCVDKEDEYNNEVKKWQNQTDIKSFSI